jgi:poly-gamma-glutamate system protein
LLAWGALRLVAPGGAIPWSAEMVEAATAMEAALIAVSQECEARGTPIDFGVDPNGTCLVGPERTELLTSLGQLQAKRTTTNPDMAGLLVHILSEAGVGPGDRVAVGASGSFPALVLATLTALEALGAEPVTILSLGASSYGATRPGFHLGDLYSLLEAEGFVSASAAAVSLGGAGDVGGEFDPAFREDLLRTLRGRDASEGGIPLLFDPVLRSNVAERMALYSAPAAFVNVGGAEANLGTSPRVLDVPPGLVAGSDGRSADGLQFPPEDQRGVLFEMAALGVPGVHLLHIRGLVLRYGLPWDPLPLPQPGTTRLADAQRGKGLWFWLLTAGYVAALAGLVFRRARGRSAL